MLCEIYDKNSPLLILTRAHDNLLHLYLFIYLMIEFSKRKKKTKEKVRKIEN